VDGPRDGVTVEAVEANSGGRGRSGPTRLAVAPGGTFEWLASRRARRLALSVRVGRRVVAKTPAFPIRNA